MSEQIVRNKRQQKKLHLGEWAILGFEFSCKLAQASETDYEQFFSSLAEFVETNNLYITLEDDSETFEGFVTSAERYGNATKKDQTSIEELLKSHAIVSDIKVSDLKDAFYDV